MLFRSDPDATGVLVVGVGRATRLMQWVTGADKDYSCELVLGSRTSTLDDGGEVLETFDMSSVTIDAARRVVSERLLGDIEQIPPMVSALKVDGKRLHELAREGIEVGRKARRITIHSLTVAPTAEPNVFSIHVTCSSGTYIRTLAADLGEALGGGAHLRRLRRTSIGPFTLADAVGIDDAELGSSREALRGMAHVVVDESVVALIRNGRSLPLFDGDGPWAVVDEQSRLVAVYEHGGDTAKPGVVFAEPIA